MSNQEIISQVITLPLDDRLFIINKVIESFNPMNQEVEQQWIDEVTNRKKLLEAGKLETISYNEFFGED